MICFKFVLICDNNIVLSFPTQFPYHSIVSKVGAQLQKLGFIVSIQRKTKIA